MSIDKWSACFTRPECTSAPTRSGDRAIGWVVDTYAQVLGETPMMGLRHSIIHANIPSDHAIQTMAALESSYDAAYPEVQAPFAHAGGSAIPMPATSDPSALCAWCHSIPS